MKNLTIKGSLTMALAALVLMIGAISALGFYSNSTSAHAIGELSEVNVEQTNAINRAQVSLLRARLMLEKFVALTRQGQDEQAQTMRQQAQAEMQEAQQRFARFSAVSKKESGHQGPHVDAVTSAYTALAEKVILPLLDGASAAEIRRQQARIAELAEAFDATVHDFVAVTEQRGQQLIAQDARTSRLVEVAAIVLLVLAILAALIVRISMLRIVVKPLQVAIEHFERIAKGDLTSHIEDRGQNEIGQLYRALAEMQAALRDLVQSLRRSSDSVFTGAGEIATGSQDLSSRTEEQASALQETASSMEQMASTVRQNTDSALEADRLSTSASQIAQEGGKEVERTVDVMRTMADSSRKINEIIEVIDSIAFQTNILALNASVEAARAGTQGRGFAVVASEVRSLASRSAASAKEIRTLIEGNTLQIERGVEQAERSGKTIGEAVASIRQVSALMNEIASATREQNSGIEQINVAVTQMDSVTQQNASLVEQTSAAAASLEDQAQQLADMIARFKVDARALPNSTSSSTEVSRPTLPSSRAPRTSLPSTAGKRTTGAGEEWTAF